jgi:NADPH:quinone reductase-like Zn-dependent oxidoreductase
MKAAIIHEFGPAEVLQLTEVENPGISDNQVLIRMKASGINPVDTKIRAGTSGMSAHLKFPAILGWDASGVIEAAGKNGSAFKPGDAVFGCIGFPGLGKTYAEFAVADPEMLALKPGNISFEEAAAIPLAGMTAFQAINEHLQIVTGQKILIQAAAGGVGHLAVQFAKMNGAWVAGTAGEKNEQFLRSLGVDQYIDYKKEKFESKVSHLDAVLDAMGGEVLYRSIPCVKRGGRVVCLPSSTRNDPKAMELAGHHGVELIWPMMHVEGGEMRMIAGLMEQKKLKVSVDRIFTLDQIGWAHKAVETHNTRGKIVVKIS